MTSNYNNVDDQEAEEDEDEVFTDYYYDDDDDDNDDDIYYDDEREENEHIKNTQSLKNKLSDIYESQKRDMLLKTWKTAVRIFTILVVLIIFLCSLVFYTTSDKNIYFLLVNVLLVCILFNCLVIT